MTDIDIDAEVRQRIDETRRSVEVGYLAEARDRGYAETFLRFKRGAKVERFLELPIGKAFAKKCESTIADACHLWLTSNDEDAVKAARDSARAAAAALDLFAQVLDDAKDAEQQLAQIEDEFGSDE